MVQQDNEFSPLDIAIPGQSLTAPLGDRPWQKPAMYSTPDEALTFYMDRFSEPRIASQMLDLMERGIPVDTLVDVLQTGGVMEGMHSLDVGIIISPAIAEAMTSMADAAEVMYVETSEEYVADQPYDTEIALALNDIAKESGEDFKNVEPVIDETEEEEPKGLMSRRQQ
mgnify:FL=1